jgi:hypothetical protein
MVGLVSLVLLLAASCGSPNPAPAEDVLAAAQPVKSADDVQRINVTETWVLVESGEGLMVDTRSAQSYSSQHAAGAISFPEAEAAGRVGELPTDKALIFY